MNDDEIIALGAVFHDAAQEQRWILVDGAVQEAIRQRAGLSHRGLFYLVGTGPICLECGRALNYGPVGVTATDAAIVDHHLEQDPTCAYRVLARIQQARHALGIAVADAPRS